MIELLVVIAIIAVLAAMLLPTLSKAQDMARGISCMNHLKQLGTVVSMYENEYKAFPVWANNPEENKNYDNWIHDLYSCGLLGDPGILFCPVAPRFATGNMKRYCDAGSGMALLTKSNNPYYWLHTGYGINYYMCSRFTAKMSSKFVKNPSVKLFIADSFEITATAGSGPTERILHYLNATAGQLQDRHSSGTATNILYCDGHAGTVKRACSQIQAPYPSSPGPNTRNPYMHPEK